MIMSQKRAGASEDGSDSSSDSSSSSEGLKQKSSLVRSDNHVFFSCFSFVLL